MDSAVVIPPGTMTPTEDDFLRDFVANLFNLEAMLDGIDALAEPYRELDRVVNGIVTLATPYVEQVDQNLLKAANGLAFEAEKLRRTFHRPLTPAPPRCEVSNWGCWRRSSELS